MNKRDERGKTSLMWACHVEGCDAIARLLMMNGANVNVRDEMGWTALHYAISRQTASEESSALVKELIAAGAQLDVVDNFGHTPLMVAARANQHTIARMLADAGASLDRRDKRGKTALIIASQHDCEEVCRALIQKNADVNAVDEAGMSAIMWASGIKVAAMLLDANCDKDGIDAKGRTLEEIMARRIARTSSVCCASPN